ncbi:MAG: hypothetical protein JSR67_15060 [Proteobacteria bacterium]|nr:hypothetical protein [Pseudomonadota bacterium]
MKSRFALLSITAAAVAALAVSSCGGGKTAGVTMTPTPPPVDMKQSLDTAQVLAQARMSSESSEPYPVNEGALVLTDTSETTESVGITGP